MNRAGSDKTPGPLNLAWEITYDGPDAVLVRSWYPSGLGGSLTACVLLCATGYVWMLAGLPAAGLWAFLFPILALLVYRALACFVNRSYIRVRRDGVVSRWHAPLPWFREIPIKSLGIAAVFTRAAAQHGPGYQIVISGRGGSECPLLKMPSSAHAAAAAQQLALALAVPVLSCCAVCGAAMPLDATHCRACRSVAGMAPRIAARGTARETQPLPLAGFQPLPLRPLLPMAPPAPERALVPTPFK